MREVYDELEKHLVKAHQVYLSPAEIDQVFRAGAIRLGGREVPLHSAIARGVEPVARLIVEEVYRRRPDLATYDAILLVGGGAYIFAPAFRQAFSVPVRTGGQGEFATAAPPEYSNAAGYLKYCLYHMG